MVTVYVNQTVRSEIHENRRYDLHYEYRPLGCQTVPLSTVDIINERQLHVGYIKRRAKEAVRIHRSEFGHADGAPLVTPDHPAPQLAAGTPDPRD